MSSAVTPAAIPGTVAFLVPSAPRSRSILTTLARFSAVAFMSGVKLM